VAANILAKLQIHLDQ